MLYIFLASAFYTVAIVCGAIASRAINSNLVTAIMNSFSALIPLFIVIPLLNKKILLDGKLGIIAAVIGGIAIAFFAMSMNKSFQTNRVGIVSPLVFGGAIFLSTIVSAVFLKEKVSPMQLLGLISLGFGLAFIVYAAATGK